MVTSKKFKGHYPGITVPEIIRRRGYPVEVHHVRTEDGYILELHRIPHGRSYHDSSDGHGRSYHDSSEGHARSYHDSSEGHDRSYHDHRPAVLVMHGLQDSSAAWVINPRDSLGFMLADHGYDVWLGNNRGNRYSRQHVHFSPDQARFWKFAADSYAKHDNPAIMDYILHVTEQKDLFYIGHSSSTWSFWAMMNYYPHYNAKVRLMLALGPVATMKYWQSIARLAVPLRDPLRKMSKKLGLHESLRYRPLYGRLGKVFCSAHSPTVPLCALGLFLLAGWDPKQLDKGSLPRILSHAPAGAGGDVQHQFAQHVASGRFQHFDHGRRGNLAVYGQPRPPLYYPELVTAPVVLLWGENDKMADKRDVAKLAARLPHLVASERVRWPLWQHLDFLWGVDAGRLVYQRVLYHMAHFTGPEPPYDHGDTYSRGDTDSNDIYSWLPKLESQARYNESREQVGSDFSRRKVVCSECFDDAAGSPEGREEEKSETGGPACSECAEQLVTSWQPPLNGTGPP